MPRPSCNIWASAATRRISSSSWPIYLIYRDAGLRAPPEMLGDGGRPRIGAVGVGISGDLPIVLVRHQRGRAKSPLVLQMVRAHEYWRVKGWPCDLVILNERAASYAQDLQKALEAIVHANDRAPDDEARATYSCCAPILLGPNDAVALCGRRRGSI